MDKGIFGKIGEITAGLLGIGQTPKMSDAKIKKKKPKIRRETVKPELLHSTIHPQEGGFFPEDTFSRFVTQDEIMKRDGNDENLNPQESDENHKGIKLMTTKKN